MKNQFLSTYSKKKELLNCNTRNVYLKVILKMKLFSIIPYTFNICFPILKQVYQ